MSTIGYEYKRRMGYMQYPSESDKDASIPPALPVPDCRRSVPAEDPPIPYDRTKLEPYYQFRRWVPPPPNPPPMIEEEKQEAACRRVRDRHLCKCRVAAKLMRPNIGVPPKFTPFFRCSLKTHATCNLVILSDFNEYIHGPRPLWLTKEQVREFENGKAPWPCESYPSDRYKCGILATQGVAPPSLAMEDFYGRHDLILKLGRTSESWKSRETQDLRDKIRSKYDVPIPDSDLLWGKIYQDMVRETGVKPKGLYASKTLIKYWR
uniref:Uncharacterized protein n=1 Tax=Setaria viridis TaxID=4556 RepID=A0A4V6DAW3_SETVI|nr:hypothetical protein SEVIR_2G095000v2 [Setaria viridis]